MNEEQKEVFGQTAVDQTGAYQANVDQTNAYQANADWTKVNQTVMNQTATPVPVKKKNKIPGIIFLIAGVILLLAGIAFLFMSNQSGKMEAGEPADIFYASETEEYSYANVQYMTEPIAAWTAMDSLQFYFVFDRDWNPAVVCMHDEEVTQYQPYIDWLYSESYENEPQETQITGYAQPFDTELKQFAMEYFNELFGEGEIIVDETNFSEWFGGYYLQTGSGSDSYGISNVGIFLILGAIVLIVIGGALVYEKPVDSYAAYGGMPVIQETHTGLGILGALLGAVLGGLLWTVIGALGYVSGWVGILIIFFAYKGYTILSHRSGGLGLAVSIIFGVLVIIPATYLYYGWGYYCAVNEAFSGYTTLIRAMKELPAYMSQENIWPEFAGNLLQGYGFMVVALILGGASLLSSKTKKKEAAKTERK